MLAELRLPQDSPPELVLLSAREKDGSLKVSEEYRRATLSAGM